MDCAAGIHRLIVSWVDGIERRASQVKKRSRRIDKVGTADNYLYMRLVVVGGVDRIQLDSCPIINGCWP